MKQVIHGLGGEMAQRMKDMGMAVHETNPVVDPEAAKYVLDEMIRDAGVKMLYHTWKLFEVPAIQSSWDDLLQGIKTLV